jgi:CRISPR/Cas system-associated exonuclease Cas4 (RecB family)
VLHEWLRTRGPLEPVFEKAFESACRKAVVSPGYATEAVRLELLRNLRGSIEQIDLPGVTRSEGEKSFQLDLGDGLALRGRIDRIDYFAEGGALVVDYKYSRLAKIKDRVKAHEDKEGTRVQGGLYMLALERQLGCRVVGMLFAAIRGEAGWNGWHLPLPGLERIGVSCVPAILRDLVDSAESKSLRAAGEIREGRVAPKPADPQQCEYCDFRDICRVETVVRILAAGEVEE